MRTGNIDQSHSRRTTRNAFHSQLRKMHSLLFVSSFMLGICVSYCLGSTVTSSGQFVTEIPIVVPPFHGLEPKLRLVYRSSPVNGWIGAGWQLDGGPSYIVRVSRGRGAPRFDGGDIFLLDGMELVPCVAASTSPSCTSAIAAFGNNNGFYSTKIENFQRIQYVGVSDSWVIWAKNGTQRVFRGNDGVRNSSGTCQWAIRSETDTHGNEVDYTYDVDADVQPPAVSQLLWISYKTSVAAGVSAINFYSTSRPDSISYGIGQAIVQLTQRLQTIDVLSGSNRVRVYALNYHTSASTSGSLLDSVRMYGSDAKVNCGGLPRDTCDTSKPDWLVVSGTSLPPMSFQYDETATGAFRAITSGEPLMNLTNIVGDFNGDGKTDYLSIGTTFDTHLSNGDGTFTLNGNTPIPNWCNNSVAIGCFPGNPVSPLVIVGDFSGDGKTDFITAAQNLNAFLSNGDGSFRVVSSPAPSFCGSQSFADCINAPIPGNPQLFPLTGGQHQPHPIAPGEIITGDFNGDGKTDFLIAKDKFYTFLSWGDGTFHVVITAPPSWCGGRASECLSNQPNHIIVGDFDGDGKTDFLSANGNFDLFRSNGDGTFTWIPIPPPSVCTDGTATRASLCVGTDANEMIVGDFNGDGKTDFMSWNLLASVGRNALVFLSNGNGSFTFSTSTGAPGFCGTGETQRCLSTVPNHVIIGDFNGDGRTDIVSVNQTFDTWIALSDGSFQQVSSAAPPPGCTTAAQCLDSNAADRVILGDFNGDGKADFLWRALNNNNSYFNTYLSQATGGPSEHLITLSNGLGETTALSYTPSSAYSNTYLPVGSLFQTVHATTINDAATAVSDTHEYTYFGGLWLDSERRFLGFSMVKETIDAARDYNETLYAQMVGCLFQPIQRYSKNSAGLIYNFSTFAHQYWAGPAPYQCLLASRTDYQAELICSDLASCTQKGARAIETDLKYDNYGNLTEIIEQGDLSVRGDERTTSVKYINPNVSEYIVALPCERQIFPGADTSGQPLRHTIFDYDEQSSPCQATKGDLTDRQDFVSGTTNPVVTKFAYDTYGNQTSVTDANNHTSTTQFDQLYNLYPVQTCNVLGRCSTLAYDTGLGKITSTMDANGAPTKYSYDVLGRLAQGTKPDGGTVQYAYEYTANTSGQPTGQLTRETLSDGGANVLTLAYSDGLGRTYRTMKQGGYEKDMQYSDSTRRVSAESEWYSPPNNAPQWTRYGYDGAGRPLTTTLPDGNQRSTAYAVGKVSKLDELRQDTTFYLDAYGRTTKVQEHNGGSNYPTTTYTYDVVGDLTQVRDAAGNYSVLTFDMLGRKLSQDDPDMGAWSNTYDSMGNVLSQTDGKNQTIKFTYDALNRVQNKIYPDGSKSTFNYDEPGHGSGISRLTSIAELASDGKAKGSDTFAYDSMGRTTSSTKCRGELCFTTNCAYDKLGRLSQLVYPDSSGKISSGSETVNYAYNQAGRLNSITSSVSRDVPYVRAIDYDQGSQISSVNYGNGVAAQFRYDPARGFLSASEVVGSGSAKPILHAAYYKHDPAGHIANISSSTNQLLDVAFTYDPLGRLTQVTGGQTQQFTYDNIGNMTSNSSVGVYSYPPAQNCSPPHPCFTHPHEVISAGGNNYAYDANGNVTSGGGRTITWNYENLPLSVTTSAGTTTFDYDALNRRVSKTEPGDPASRYYFSPLVERTPTGDIVYSYYAGPTLVARRIASSSSVTWYHQDHLASVRTITDAKGNVANNYDYTAFGTTLAPASDPTDPYGFTGQLRNPSTSISGSDVAGLIYMNARYYDATLGRFISADSIIPDIENPQSLNRYSYGLDNPVSFSDPTGHVASGVYGVGDRQAWRERRVWLSQSLEMHFAQVVGVDSFGFLNDYIPSEWLDARAAWVSDVMQQWYANPDATMSPGDAERLGNVISSLPPQQLDEAMYRAMSANSAPAPQNTDIGMIAAGEYEWFDVVKGFSSAGSAGISALTRAGVEVNPLVAVGVYGLTAGLWIGYGWDKTLEWATGGYMAGDIVYFMIHGFPNATPWGFDVSGDTFYDPGTGVYYDSKEHAWGLDLR